LKKKPCSSSQDLFAQEVGLRLGLDACATTVRLRVLPIAMIALVSARSSAPVATSRMNERSILIVSRGKPPK
jgi:hypothetical protein